MPENLIIKNWTVDGIEVIKISGFMDITQVKPFEELLDHLIQKSSTKIVLDFSNLEYISSSGLGAIIGRIHQVRKQKGDIIIGGCSEAVSEILNVFGFASVFCLAKSPQAALQMFAV